MPSISAQYQREWRKTHPGRQSEYGRRHYLRSLLRRNTLDSFVLALEKRLKISEEEERFLGDFFPPDQHGFARAVLVTAISRSCLRVIDLVAKCGHDLDRPCPDGVTPLQRAVRLGRVDVSKELLEWGATPDPAMAEAVRSRELVFVLLEYGADPRLGVDAAVRLDDWSVADELFGRVLEEELRLYTSRFAAG